MSTSVQNARESLVINRILVEDLFGRYTYKLELESENTMHPQLMLLYGENGTGKTTILSLMCHLLSKETGKGHRTFLARSRFRRLAVRLSNGSELIAYRRSELVGSFRMELRRAGRKYAFFYRVESDGSIGSLTDNIEHDEFTARLPDLTLYFLSDDRKMATEIELEDRESPVRQLEIRQLTRLWSTRGEPVPPTVMRTEPVLSKLVQWVREQALAGSNEGQLNVNSIYSEIVARIVQPTPERRVFLDADGLARALAEQAVRNHQYSRFGLTSELEVGNLVDSVLRSKDKKTRVSVIAQILKPFIDGNEARLRALESIQKTLETFVTNINSFYTDKELTFHIRDGIRIISKDGEPLDPSLLSSGEKQLLILFCNVIMTGGKPSIFFIDEPELSLNIKWQRQLVGALLSCVRAGSVQFVLATHSLEILAKHRRSVVRLSNQRDVPPSRQVPMFDET